MNVTRQTRALFIPAQKTRGVKKGFFLKGVNVFETRDQALQHTENTPILQTCRHMVMDSCV